MDFLNKIANLNEDGFDLNKLYSLATSGLKNYLD